jgi:hypothetical protein
MAVSLSALRAVSAPAPVRFLALFSIIGLFKSRPIVQLEELGTLQKSLTSLGIEPATFLIVE